VPKPTLRVATEADARPLVRKLSLADAVESGTYLEILTAQRRQMIGDLREAKGPALAALHRQIALLSKEIDTLQSSAEQEAAELDEVADEAFDAEAL
jgi:hypothetical protein